MFLLYINDISENLTSHIRLFADDYIMYRPIIHSRVAVLHHKTSQWEQEHVPLYRNV